MDVQGFSCFANAFFMPRHLLPKKEEKAVPFPQATASTAE